MYMHAFLAYICLCITCVSGNHSRREKDKISPEGRVTDNCQLFYRH